MYFLRAHMKFTLISFAALCLAAPASSAPKVKSLTAPNLKAETTYQSCKTLSHCVDILERHDSDSFDYAVLAQDLDRFGEKGRQALWRLIDAGADGNQNAQKIANRALDMLSRSLKILPPAEQRRMVAMWTSQAGQPYEPEILARLMTTNLSPMVRSTAINTLGSENESVAFFSRAILAETLRRKMDFPMPPADFAPLSRAALSTPSPTLAALIALYPADTSAPALARLLASGHEPTVIEAYSALFEEDAENAFKALVSTLYGLNSENSKAAIAIGGLLAHRHPLRSDGFYMKFASELSQDPEMSPAGRTAGFDALLRRQGQKDVPALSDTPMNTQNFAFALSAFGENNIPSPYFSVPQMMGGKDADAWLTPLSKAARTPLDKIALVEVAGNFQTPFAKEIARDALQSNGDYRLLVAGILASSAQAQTGEARLKMRLSETVKNNPFSMVRAASALGLAALDKTSPRKAIKQTQPTLANAAQTFDPASAFCNVQSMNLRALARAMPYYDPAQLSGRLLADRAFLTTGARTKNGWLAGYSHPNSGGLVQYDNVSGKGRELFAKSPFGPQAVIAVHPTAKVPLGQTAGAFWVFATSLQTGESAIYRAAQSASATTVQLSRQAVLPAQPSAINIQDNGDITFAMGRVNPPLMLSQNGTLARACESKTRLEKTPS